MAFDEVQFPPDIAWGATGGPAFSTGVLTSTVGYEFRNRQWSASLATYDVSHATRTQEEMDILVAFYRAREGTIRGFRFKDWMDFKMQMNPSLADTAGGDEIIYTAVPLAAGDTFQLTKSYGDSESTYLRAITKITPDSGVTGYSFRWYTDLSPVRTDADTINLGGSPDLTLDPDTGILTWNSDDANTIISISAVSVFTELTVSGDSLGEFPVGSTIHLSGISGTAAATLNDTRLVVVNHSDGSGVLLCLLDITGLSGTGGAGVSALQSGEEILASDYEFDVPVRFGAEKLSVSIDSFENYSSDKIELLEVRDPAISVAQTEPTNSFHDVRLDPKITFGATGAPRFKTNVFTTTGGHNTRVGTWDEDRPEYDVSLALKDFEDFRNILDFFYARYGKAYGFRFRDWQDYNMSGTEGGVDQATDGIVGLFNLAKKYTSGAVTFYRQITAPIEPNEEIVPAKYGSQQFAPDFTIAVDGVDVDHDANAQFFDINGRTVRDTAGAVTGTSRGTMDFSLTLRDGESGADNIINITGISQADPAVVTHTEDSDAGIGGAFIQGFLTGETVFISGIGGMTQVNDRRFKITKITDFTFSLDGEDSTGHTAFSSDGVGTKLPQSGEEVVVTGDFDVPVRFGADSMAFTHENYGFHTWGGIPIEGIRLK